MKKIHMSETELGDAVARAVEKYINDLDGEIPSDGIYKRVIREVEVALFGFVYFHEKRNQSNATKVLGISRATFRQKLKDFDLM